MAIFIRSLHEADKEMSLQRASRSIRNCSEDPNVFSSDPHSFSLITNSPFAYWVSRDVLDLFSGSNSTASESYVSLYGLISSDNFRFLRLNWELSEKRETWRSLSKGGDFSKYYGDIYLTVNIKENFSEIVALANAKYPYLKGKARQMIHADVSNYFHPGITWTKATTAPLSFRALPINSVAGNGGSAFSAPIAQKQELLASMAILNSTPFSLLSSLSLGLAAEGRKNYEIGIIEKTPLPILDAVSRQALASFSLRSWQLKRMIDATEETSHAFMLPAVLIGSNIYSPLDFEIELEEIQLQIDAITFDLYGFSKFDRIAAQTSQGKVRGSETDICADDEIDDDDITAPIDQTTGLLSWAVGVAFGRFDWRLATRERSLPAEPEPFDPLPAKSPGVLPDGAESFHRHAGILVDDQGHPHDVARLVEHVLVRVDVSVPDNIRRWLQRDFFTFHLQRYSKSRRKAPIYWPLATASGGYTLWVYYPSLNNQTLFSAVNDFLDGPNGKLTQVSRECAELRMKGSGRSRDEEKQYETLQAFEQELTDLRDTLLKIAPSYQPNHDDGVQITAAPLWPLFRHKPWQKVLKDTWTKLEKGDYDWAHLAMAYWPDRVREKCKTDKSLAIAHGLEEMYVEPEAAPKKARGQKKAGVEE